MKSFKLIVVIVLSFVLGNQISYSQSKNTKNSEQYMPTEAVSQKSNRNGYSKKNRKTNKVIKGAETDQLFSDKEKKARALTAQKSKQSGKRKLTKEQNERRIEERVRAIKENNKKKKKVLTKRNN